MELALQAYSNNAVSFGERSCLQERLLFPLLERVLLSVGEGMPNTGSASEVFVL